MRTMKTSAIIDFMKYLISPEETWDSSMELHKENPIRNSVKFLVWYVLSMASAMGLCMIFR